MSQVITLARPYARAAFEAAKAQGQLTDWSQSLAFAARVAADPSVAALLGDPRRTREQAVGLVAPQGAGEGLRNFLAVMARNGRLSALPEVAGLYEELRAEAEHLVRAKITSAAPMTSAELDNIKAGLKRRFGRDVEVETHVDESLIGGAIIDAGEMVIDGSLKGKLARLQTALAQ